MNVSKAKMKELQTLMEKHLERYWGHRMADAESDVLELVAAAYAKGREEEKERRKKK